MDIPGSTPTTTPTMPAPFKAEDTSSLADDAQVTDQLATANVETEAPAPADENALDKPQEALEPEVDYQAQIAALEAKIEGMRPTDNTPNDLSDALGYSLADEPASGDVTGVTDNTLPDFGDLYDEVNYKNNVANYINERTKLATDNATSAVFNDPKFKAMENTLYTREHELAVTQAKEKFGDSFDYEKNGANILAAQRQLVGLQLSDGHRILDYDRLQEENRKLKEAAGARQTTKQPETGGAGTRFVQKDDKSVTVKLTPEQMAASDKYLGPGNHEKYAARLAAKKG